MKCKNCGNILSEDATSCFLCGSTDLEKISKKTEEIPSLIMNSQINPQVNYVEQNNKIKNNGKIFILIILTSSFILGMLSLISSIFFFNSSVGVSSNEFQKYMKDNNYEIDNLTNSGSNYNNFDYYYIAKNKNYSIVYLYSDNEILINNSYNNVKNSIIRDESSNVKDKMDITLEDFSKYALDDNNKYKIVVKNKNTVMFSNANTLYKNDINQVFEDLGYYEHKTNIIPILLLMLSLLSISLLFVVSLWKIFIKTGRKGYISLIPFYNLYILTNVTVGNGWLFLIMFIPLVNLIFLIYLSYRLAKMFGKSTGYAIGTMFLGIIFIPLLAFDDSIYLGIKKTN